MAHSPKGNRRRKWAFSGMAVAAAFLLMHILLFRNAWFHDPRVGYDAIAFIRYTATLAGGRLPERKENYEYFSPPLAFVLPALLLHWRALGVRGALKSLQFADVLASAVLVLLFLRLLAAAIPERPELRLLGMAALGMFPVYYKTWAFYRSAPLLACFHMIAAAWTVRLAHRCSVDSTRRDLAWDSLGYGLVLGGMMLTRQWAFFSIFGLAVFWGVRFLADQRHRPQILTAGAVAAAAALAVSGWFYLHLWREYGTAAAFNRAAAPRFSLAAQPRSFYFGTGNGALFKRPINPAFPNQVLPILYSGMWGDYWCYFQVYGIDAFARRYCVGGKFTAVERGSSSARAWIVPDYSQVPRLALANRLGLGPSLFLGAWFGIACALTAAGFSRRSVRRADGWRPGGPAGIAMLRDVCVLMSFFGALGYFVFLVRFPEPNFGKTIKASYLLHLLPLGILAACSAMASFHGRWVRWLAWTAAAVFLAVWLINLPLMQTRIVEFR